MANMKKMYLARKCVAYNIIIGLIAAFIPYVLLGSFTCAYLILYGLTTFSTINVIQRYEKSFSKFWLDIKHSDFSDVTVLSTFKYGLILITGTCVYYVGAVLFGASVFESCMATLYFSCFMVLLTVYPLCWYLCFSENGVAGIFQMFLESKCETAVENYFHLTAKCSVFGAWVGAFPIPLDWDRPWQEWPQTCCIGAVLGYAAAHFFISIMTLWASYKEKRQFSWKLFI